MSLRILHVGVGVRGSHWLDFVAAHPDFESVAAVDPSTEARARVGRDGTDPIVSFADLPTALAEVEADAAVIASPSPFHADQTKACLKAGLAVLVEKPFADSVAEARDVLAVSEQAGRPVVVAENYRFWPSERTIRHLVAEGRIGRVDCATVVDRRPMPVYRPDQWEAALPHPQLQELAIHHFDSLRAWFDREPTSLAARTWKPSYSRFGSPTSSDALIDMDGVRVQYLGTMTSHRFSFSLMVEGENGAIWSDRKRVFVRPAGSRFFRPVRAVRTPAGDRASYPKGGTASLLNALRDAALHGAAAETSGFDNLGTVAMVEAARRSVTEGRTVELGEVLGA